jgi:hypothetical protein
VTFQAECSHIREIALPAAFGNRHTVVGIPQRLAALFAQPPFLQEFPSGGEIEAAQIAAKRHRIRPALGADSVVALQNLFAQVAGVGP